jgi:hypothetical protein
LLAAVASNQRPTDYEGITLDAKRSIAMQRVILSRQEQGWVLLLQQEETMASIRRIAKTPNQENETGLDSLPARVTAGVSRHSPRRLSK